MPLFLCNTIQTADLHTWRIVNGFALVEVKDSSQVAKENLIAFMKGKHSSDDDSLIFPENEEMSNLDIMAKSGRIVFYYCCTERAQLLANLKAQKQGKKAAGETKETKKGLEQKTASPEDPFAEVKKALEAGIQRAEAKRKSDKEKGLGSHVGAEEVCSYLSLILKEETNHIKILAVLNYFKELQGLKESNVDDLIKEVLPPVYNCLLRFSFLQYAGFLRAFEQMGLEIEPKTFEKVFPEITLAADENKKVYLMTAMDFFKPTPFEPTLSESQELFFSYADKSRALEVYAKQAFQVWSSLKGSSATKAGMGDFIKWCIKQQKISLDAAFNFLVSDSNSGKNEWVQVCFDFVINNYSKLPFKERGELKAWVMTDHNDDHDHPRVVQFFAAQFLGGELEVADVCEYCKKHKIHEKSSFSENFKALARGYLALARGVLFIGNLYHLFFVIKRYHEKDGVDNLNNKQKVSQISDELFLALNQEPYVPATGFVSETKGEIKADGKGDSKGSDEHQAEVKSVGVQAGEVTDKIFKICDAFKAVSEHKNVNVQVEQRIKDRAFVAFKNKLGKEEDTGRRLDEIEKAQSKNIFTSAQLIELYKDTETHAKRNTAVPVFEEGEVLTSQKEIETIVRGIINTVRAKIEWKTLKESWWVDKLRSKLKILNQFLTEISPDKFNLEAIKTEIGKIIVAINEVDTRGSRDGETFEQLKALKAALTGEKKPETNCLVM